MREPYTEQDTEHARRVEGSSAGKETQQLSLPPELLAASPPQRQGRRGWLGMILVGLGALFLLLRLFSLPVDITGGMIMLTIASVFFFFGFWRHIYGLIIPGSLLAGLSLGIPFAELTDGVSVLWGLALGFLGVYVLGFGLFGRQSTWPSIPAVILFAVGMIVAISNLPAFLGAAMLWVPLLLIGAGLYLGWMRRS